MAQFEEKEKQRIKATIDDYDQKCKMRMDSLIHENEMMLKDIENTHVSIFLADIVWKKRNGESVS